MRVLLTAVGVSGTVFASGISYSQIAPIFTPWNPDRLEAMVRIEHPQGSGTSVGSGFLVDGTNGTYVLTAAHVVFEPDDAATASKDCKPFTSPVSLYRKQRNGESLTHAGCAWNLGADLVLIPLPKRSSGYPVLRVAAREFYQYDLVYPAGYPNGYDLDQTRVAKVAQLHAENDLVGSEALTLEGMSGGPYLSSKGNVVGVHTSGVRYRAGLALFTAIGRNRARLEPVLGSLEVEPAQPPNLVYVELRARASTDNLGSLLALHAAPTDKEKSRLWQTVSGQALTAFEARLLRKTDNEEPRGAPATVLKALQLPTEDGPAAIGLGLSQLATLSKAECLAEVTWRDGVMLCGGRDRFIESSRSGQGNEPKLIVMHFTATANLRQTIAVLTSMSIQSSAHFVIDRDGTVVQTVSTDRAAWHAGRSAWGALTGINRHSIGIELINLGQLAENDRGEFHSELMPSRIVPPQEVMVVEMGGETTYWHRYSAEQIAMAKSISRALVARYPIQAIVGHCEVAPDRKVDPGPAFPLAEFNQSILQRDGGPGCAPRGRANG